MKIARATTGTQSSSVKSSLCVITIGQIYTRRWTRNRNGNSRAFFELAAGNGGRGGRRGKWWTIQFSGQRHASPFQFSYS